MMRLEDGIYWADIVSAMLTTSSKGTPDFAVKLSVTNRADAGFKENNGWMPLDKPVERTLHIYCSEAAWETSLQKLQTLGFNGDFDNPDFTAKGVRLSCRTEEYNGKPSEKWELDGWGERKEPEPAGADVSRRLTALWKNDNPAPTPKPAGRPATPAPAPADAAVPVPVAAGDEPPF